MYNVDDMSKYNINPQTGEITPKNNSAVNYTSIFLGGSAYEPESIQSVSSELNLNPGGVYFAEIQNGDKIILPEVSGYTEIRLWFEATTDLTIEFPQINWQGEPESYAGYIYEYIFTYINNKWVGGFVSYEMVGDN